jgi:hypothetical protein
LPPPGRGRRPLFAAICLASGLALGADLALPGALLTGVIHQAGAGQQGEGRYLGWWACATKLNLALAAGLALPLLAAAGYQPGALASPRRTTPRPAGPGLGLRRPALLLKLAALALLWRAEQRHPTWRDTA